jgi:hypothetical protein
MEIPLSQVRRRDASSPHAEPRPEFSGVEQFFPFFVEDIPFPLGFLITVVTSKVTVKVIL